MCIFKKKLSLYWSLEEVMSFAVLILVNAPKQIMFNAYYATQ